MVSTESLHAEIAALVLKGDWAELLKLLRSGAIRAGETIKDAKTGMRTPLLPVAIREKASELAMELIHRGADIHGAYEGRPALIEAVATGQRNLVEMLLTKNVDVNATAGRDEEGGGETALMLAAENGDHPALTRLLQAGADPKLLSGRKYSAVFFAVQPKRKADTILIIKELVAHGCPLTGEELHAPAYRRDVEVVCALLDCKCPANVPLRYGEDMGPKKGTTPLLAAAAYNGCDHAEDVPELGIEATGKKREEIARLLLAAGADPNTVNPKGWTPLLYAVHEKELQLAQILVEGGADPSFSPPKSRHGSPMR